MTVRAVSIAALIAFCGLLDVAQATADYHVTPENPATGDGLAASFRPEAVPLVSRIPPGQAAISAYRRFARNQSDNLVMMTKALATGVKQGDVGAAQSVYPSAHRFFKRIEPLARTLRNFDKRMDAGAEAYAAKETDPEFAGFHRLEYGLFARGSTADLADPADRLRTDAQALMDEIAYVDIAPGTLLAGSADLVREIADRGLTGDEERYAKTDLWDVEANLEGVREVVAMVRPQVGYRSMRTIERTDAHFATIAALLEKHKEGCGFKSYDEVGKSDRAALRIAVAALAEELSSLRGALAMN